MEGDTAATQAAIRASEGWADVDIDVRVDVLGPPRDEEEDDDGDLAVCAKRSDSSLSMACWRPSSWKRLRRCV